MTYLDKCREMEAANPDLAVQEKELQSQMQQEARKRIDELRSEMRDKPAEEAGGDVLGEDDEDDDIDVEVEYRP